MKRLAFDINKALPAAWELLWTYNLNARKKREGFRNETFYLTASDLECQVRRFAEETAAGEAWGSRGRAWGRGYGSGGIRFPGNLLGVCRDWLSREARAGRLQCHNFGRGHISGMRYRPAGEPLSEPELKTLAAHERQRAKPRPRPVHARKGGGLACAPPGKRVWGFRPSKAHAIPVAAGDKGDRLSSGFMLVTCARCRKVLGWEAVDAGT